jgi:hypothetical protein
MALTKPTLSQLNTGTVYITDPLTVFNSLSTQANIDVGLLFNRNGGVSSNVAVFWNEANSTFALSYTTSNGAVYSNVSITSYANLRVNYLTGTLATAAQPNVTSIGNLTSLSSAGNITSYSYFIGDGSKLTGVTAVAGAGGADTQIQYNDNGTLTGGPGFTFNKTSNLVSISGNVTSGHHLPLANITYDLGTPTLRWRTGYFSANTIDLGGNQISVDPVTGFTFTVAGAAPTASATKPYVDGQITAANAGVTSANVGMKGYVDAVSTAWTANAYQQQALIGNLQVSTYSNVNLSAYLGGAVTIGGNLTINGNLFVNGNVTTINANNLNINDSLIYLADDNPADTLDIGFVSAFTNPGYQHTGFVRDATDGVWKLFANVVAEPTTTVDFTNATYSNILVGNVLARTIIAESFTGNGAALTGLPAGYSNVNAATYLVSGTLATAINTTGNVLSTGLSVFGNTRIGSLAVPGALHTIIGNVDVSGAGTEYFNIGGNIMAVQASFGSINSTGLINTTGNILSTGAIHNSLTVNGTTTLAGNTYLNSSGYTIFGSYNLDPANGPANLALYQAAGRTIMGWNYSAGRGEFGIICDRDGGSPGGLRIYDWSTANVRIANVLMDINYSQGLTVYGNVSPSTSNTYTLGSTTAWWTTTYSKAMQAQYADLAEVYTSDQQYPAGTVVIFGGEQEVTQSRVSHDTRIAGVVSTDPAYLMNSTATGVPVALQGRVPCRVLGPISKGDRVVSSHIAGVAQALDPQQYQPGCIIGKALQSIETTTISTIEVVVGRL